MMAGGEGPPCCTECGSVLPIIAEQAQIIHDLEVELRVKRATITKLRNEEAERNRTGPWAADAEEVFAHWKQTLAPRAREFNGKRLDAVIARLKAGHTLAELKRAIDGVAARPYVTEVGRCETGTSSQRQVELELICRSEANVHRFQGYAPDPEPEEPQEAWADLDALIVEVSDEWTRELARKANEPAPSAVSGTISAPVVAIDFTDPVPASHVPPEAA